MAYTITEKEFNQTQTDPALQSYRDRIRNTLFIQWNATRWEELRKPLYSALATQLSSLLRTGGWGIPITTEEQAALWANGSLVANVFMKAVQQLEIGLQFQQDVDIAFVLDSSASMSDVDFEKAKLFIQNAIKGLPVDNGKARVAVVEFSTAVYPQFGLNNNMDSRTMEEAVRNITYSAGGTRTDLALEYVRDTIFQESSGARPGATKLIVLVTDGVSDDTVATVTVARQLRASGVTISVVGVGEYIDTQELQAVVSQPSCSYIQTVTNFTDLPNVGYNTAQLAKQNPVVLKTGVYNFSCFSDLTAEILPGQTGLTINVQTLSGAVALYGGISNAFVPSPSLFAFRNNVTSDTPVQIHVRDGSRVLLALRNLTDGGCSTYYTVTVRDGNILRVANEKVCIESGLVSACGINDYEKSPFIVTKPPPANEIPASLCKSNTDSFTAPYPGHMDRFLMCRSGRMIVVYCEMSQQYDIIHSRCVEAGITRAPTTTTQTQTRLVTTTGVAPPVESTTAAPPGTTAAPPGTTAAPPSTTAAPPLVNPCTIDNILNGHMYFKFAGDERKYIHCSIFPGVGTISSCEEHHYFSETVLTCLNKDAYEVETHHFVDNVTNPCFTTGTNGSLQYYPYPGDAHKFIQCDQYGDAYVKECRKTLVWDNAHTACVQDSRLVG